MIEYLVGLDAEWEGRMARWTPEVQNALVGGGALALCFGRDGGPAERNVSGAQEHLDAKGVVS